MRRWFRDALIDSGIGAGGFALVSRGFPLWIIGAAPAFGLWGRDERAALRWIAASVGASCEVVYLPVDRELQLSRVRGRWECAPQETFPMTEAELDAWRSQFEVPDASELSGTSLPSPPPGNESWFDWAARRWPSLG